MQNSKWKNVFWIILLVSILYGMKSIHSGSMKLVKEEYQLKKNDTAFEVNYYSELNSISRKFPCKTEVYLYSNVKKDHFPVNLIYYPLDEKIIARYAFATCRIILSNKIMADKRENYELIHSSHSAFLRQLKSKKYHYKTENFILKMIE